MLKGIHAPTVRFILGPCKKYGYSLTLHQIKFVKETSYASQIKDGLTKSLNEISEIVGCSRSRITSWMKRLIEQEIITKSPGKYRKNLYQLHPSFVENVLDYKESVQNLIVTKGDHDSHQKIPVYIINNNINKKQLENSEISTTLLPYPERPKALAILNSDQQQKPKEEVTIFEQSISDNTSSRPSRIEMSNPNPPSPPEKVSIEQFKPTSKHIARMIEREIEPDYFLGKFQSKKLGQNQDMEGWNKIFGIWIEKEIVLPKRAASKNIQSIIKAPFYRDRIPEEFSHKECNPEIAAKYLSFMLNGSLAKFRTQFQGAQL